MSLALLRGTRMVKERSVMIMMTFMMLMIKMALRIMMMKRMMMIMTMMKVMAMMLMSNIDSQVGYDVQRSKLHTFQRCSKITKTWTCHGLHNFQRCFFKNT